MAANLWRERIDLVAGNYLITTSATDASCVLPSHINDQYNNPTQVIWRMFVVGSPANIAYGRAAVSTDPLFPIGGDDAPKVIAAGTWHALGSATAGQVFFVPCFVV